MTVNFVFYLVVVVALIIMAIIAYPIVTTAINLIREDLREYYDNYDVQEDNANEEENDLEDDIE